MGTFLKAFISIAILVLNAMTYLQAQEPGNNPAESRSVDPPLALIHAGTSEFRGSLDNLIGAVLEISPQQKDALNSLSRADLESETTIIEKTGKPFTRREKSDRCWSRLEKVLDAKQFNLAFLICLQLEGPRAIEFANVSSRLQLRLEQRNQVSEITTRFEEVHLKNMNLNQADPRMLNPDTPKVLSSIIKAAEEEEKQILAVLDPKQLIEWSILIKSSPRIMRNTTSLTGVFPSLSADGRFLLFQSDWFGLNSFVSITDLHLGITSRMTAYDRWGLCPRYSPDGHAIVYSSSQEGTFGIFLMDKTGAQVKRLTDPSLVADEGACFSHDATTITFGTRNSGIYTIRKDGSNLSRILARGHRPCFSPDGRNILFQNSPVRGFMVDEEPLSIVATDGSNVRTLPLMGYDPVFSPDGLKVAYLSGVKGNKNSQVMIADSNGILSTPLTSSASYKGDISFSKDGQQLLYWESELSSYGGNIMILNISKKEAKQLKLD